MLFSPRARNRDLAELCRRLAISLESGIEVRKVFARESEGRTSGALRSRLQIVQQRVAAGQSIAEGLDLTGDYFPKLFRELVKVGEQTGHLDQVFRHLAQHYEHQEMMRKEFISSITWPLMQLFISVCVIGLVIWVSGLIDGKDFNGKDIDILGFGLKGASGALTYFHIVAWIVIGVIILIQCIKRGVFWVRPLQRMIIHVPYLGTALETMAVARFAWSLHLTTESGMGLLKALPLCLQTMQNARYSDHIAPIVAGVQRGDTLTETLSSTGVFPVRFLDAVEVGEQSGRLPETMELLSDQYQDESRRAIKVVMQVASWLVALAVMGFIVFFIFRIASFYLGMINDAMKM
jgi:type II secretory pathway component PulF